MPLTKIHAINQDTSSKIHLSLRNYHMIGFQKAFGIIHRNKLTYSGHL